MPATKLVAAKAFDTVSLDFDRVDELKRELTRHDYDAKAIADQFGARVIEVHQLLCGTLKGGGTRQMRGACLSV